MPNSSSASRLNSDRLAYQPPASSTFVSEQTSHQQPANSTFLSEQTSISHQPPAKRTGRKVEESPPLLLLWLSDAPEQVPLDAQGSLASLGKVRRIVPDVPPTATAKVVTMITMCDGVHLHPHGRPIRRPVEALDHLVLADARI
jgi:hypothetical protein